MSPIATGTILKPMPARFWDKVEERGPDDCWEWTGARDGPNEARHCHLDYGLFGIKENGHHRTWMAHRMAYTLRYGPIPEGMLVLHSCDNPPCCNPRHLRLGTHADNMEDRDSRGRLGDRRGEANAHARLTDADVREIRGRYAAGGTTQQQLADEYGVIQAHVSRIVRGRSWAAQPDGRSMIDGRNPRSSRA